MPEDPMFWIYLGIAVFLACFAGICSGLTVGYLSIDDLELEIIIEGDTSSKEKREAAKAIAPILKNHHLLLCTLLISNAAAMEALPIFLDALVPAWLAIVLSCVAVVTLGEIVP